MKRSRINDIMQSAEGFIQKCGFYLPPFAQWTPEDWRKKGSEATFIVENNLGWDVTDFGSGDFDQKGLFLFTLRNGNLHKPGNVLYAEKLMVVGINQITPMHFHRNKSEDIINRSGGKLIVQLYLSTNDEQLDKKSDVRVLIDGQFNDIPAGKIIELKPGQSITMIPLLYHCFWGKDGRVLVGEVSSVNDDHSDNRFLEPQARFPTIEEDVAPLHLLVGDYLNYYQNRG